MADNTVTGAVTSSIRPQARPTAVSGIGAKTPARQEEKAEMSFMDRITNLFTGFGGKDPNEKPASVNTYNAKISVYQDMEDEARTSAELARQDRQGLGITRSLTGQEWAQTFGKEKALEPNITPPFWYQGQEHPEALTPAPVEVAAIPAQTMSEGLMARSGNIRNEPPEPTLPTPTPVIFDMFTRSGNRVTPNITSIEKFAKDTFTNPVAAAAFVSTVQHESGTSLLEGGRLYSRALGRNRTPKEVSDLLGGNAARKQAFEDLATNQTYINGDDNTKNAMIFDIYYDDQYRDAAHKLGNTQAGDGSRFRGRGLIQITGRDNYQKIGDAIGVDLVANPDLLLTDMNVMLKATLAYMDDKGFNTKNITAKSLRNIIGHSGGDAEANARWSDAQAAYTRMYGGTMPANSRAVPPMETSPRPKAKSPRPYIGPQ